MRYLSPGIVLLIAAVALHAADAGDNKDVACRVIVSDTLTAPGDIVTVSFMLTPADGIHINAMPAPEFSLSQPKELIAADTLHFSANAATGYLNSEHPLTCTLTISQKLPAGMHTVQGTLSYFFCSETKGWCNYFDQSVIFHIRIRQ